MDNTFSTADLPATPGFLAFQGRGPLTSNPDNNDDIWDNDRSAVRGQLLWEPNADVTVLLTGHYAYQEKASFQFQELSTVAIVDDTDGDVC